MPLHIFFVAGPLAPLRVASLAGTPIPRARSRRGRTRCTVLAAGCATSASAARSHSNRSPKAPKSTSRSSRGWNVTTYHAGRRESSENPSSGPTPKRSDSIPTRSYASSSSIYPDPLEVEVAAPAAVARVVHPQSGSTDPVRPTSSGSPLAIKLTITWSGSVHQSIGRLADWRIARIPSWLRISNLPIFQSTNLPMVRSSISPRESEGAVQDQIPPA